MRVARLAGISVEDRLQLKATLRACVDALT
jgi:hypothetical protein